MAGPLQLSDHRSPTLDPSILELSPALAFQPPPTSFFFKTDRRLWGPRAEFSRATTTFEVLFHCGSVFIKAVVTSAIRLPCDCNSTARYNHSTTCVTTVGLPVWAAAHWGLRKNMSPWLRLAEESSVHVIVTSMTFNKQSNGRRIEVESSL